MIDTDGLSLPFCRVEVVSEDNEILLRLFYLRFLADDHERYSRDRTGYPYLEINIDLSTIDKEKEASYNIFDYAKRKELVISVAVILRGR